MCMSRLIMMLFALADSSCLPHEESENYKMNKQIRRIMVPRPATNLTLRLVKGQGQGHRMVPIERACHNDHAC